MFGWEALKLLMTLSNVLSWSSPPLRQQNHLIWTGPPGGTVGGALGPLDSDGEADATATAEADGLGVAVGPPQAANTSDMTASRAASRARDLCTRLLLHGCYRSAGGGSGVRSCLLLLGSGRQREAGRTKWISVAIRRVRRAGAAVVTRNVPPTTDDDVALDVIPGPIAPDVRVRELDRRALGGVRDAFDEESGRPPRLAEQSCLTGAQQHRLERLAGAGEMHAVALRQDAVERAVLQVRREEAGKPLGREVDLLEEERLAVGDAQALEVEDR